MAQNSAERFGTKVLTKEERIEKNKEGLKVETGILKKQIKEIKDAGADKGKRGQAVIKEYTERIKQYERDCAMRIMDIEQGNEKITIHKAPYSKAEKAIIKKKRSSKKDEK